ncbi:sugar ABC transporter ATP-binding protein [Streptosporangium longisporum]|uniref:Ribose ABC transporter ATP-binding protein RbsA n=1 Tax=Streptosporangium longisporum TaxID=46187 RepID=A0ABP6KX98_9ACTN
MSPVVSMSKVRLAFPGTQALDGADFEIEPGEIRSLLGENGAGKSTLMKVLAGAEHPDEGEIRVDGEVVAHQTPRNARELGIAMVFQEMSLAPNLTVAENITLGRPPASYGVVSWNGVRERAAEALEQLNVGVPLDALARTLTIAQQQMVEIAKAVAGDLKVLILDEPTSALTETETQELFTLIRRLSARGIAVVYISHNLEEIFVVCDSVTVMRDGRTIATHRTAETDVDRLIGEMVGRVLSDMMPKESIPRGEVVLDVRDLVVDGKDVPVSFRAHRGEVLGFAGLLGAGRTALMRCLVGDIPRTSGTVELHGRPLDPRRPGDAIRRGLGYLSDDRRASGIVGGLSVRENIGMACLSLNARYGVMKSLQERRLAVTTAERLRIVTNGVEKKVGELSGGNQQKVVLGKWMAAGVEVLILDEPTRGIDVGAKAEVYQLVNDLAREGKAVILVSSYLPEVLGMSDRVLVMRAGSIVGEYDREDATSESVMYDATGQAKPEEFTRVTGYVDSLLAGPAPGTPRGPEAPQTSGDPGTPAAPVPARPTGTPEDRP